VIAEKDKQIKQTEDSLANEHDHLTSKEEELKDIQNMNFLLKAEVQKLQALANEQAAAAHELEKMQKSIHVKDDQIRLLEEQLQCEISNKMEDFKILNDQNKALQLEVQKLQTLVSEQMIRIKRWKLFWHLQKSKNHYPSIKRLNKKVDQERRKFLQRSKRQKTSW